jgi:hypothetical protein
MAAKFIDLVAREFGSLTVIAHAGLNAKRQSMWRCRCRCRELKVVRGSDLKESKTRSCGAACELKQVEREKEPTTPETWRRFSIIPARYS